LSRSSGIREIPLTGAGSGITRVASLALPVSGQTEGTPVLIVYPDKNAPAGLLPLLDDLARAGSCAMSCPIPVNPDTSVLQNAIGTFTGEADVPPGRVWVLAYLDTARAVLTDAAFASVAGWVLLDPALDAEDPVDLPPAHPTGIFSTGRNDAPGETSLRGLYEALSGEDTTLSAPAESEGPTRSMTYLAARGDTRLTLYHGNPSGLGLLSRWFARLARGMGTADDYGRWAERFSAHALRRDRSVCRGCVGGRLCFGSLARFVPRGYHARTGVTVRIADCLRLLLVCVTLDWSDACRSGR
jgi:hypothetical protein